MTLRDQLELMKLREAALAFLGPQARALYVGRPLEEIIQAVVEREPTMSRRMRGTKFEIYRDVKKEWRGRLVAGNGEIVTASEGYSRKSAALKWAERLKLWVATANITVLD